MHTDSGAAWLKSVFLLKCESIQPCLARGASTCVIVTMVNTAARIMANVYKYMYMYLCSYGEAINTSYKHYHVADKTGNHQLFLCECMHVLKRSI